MSGAATIVVITVTMPDDLNDAYAAARDLRRRLDGVHANWDVLDYCETCQTYHPITDEEEADATAH